MGIKTFQNMAPIKMMMCIKGVGTGSTWRRRTPVALVGGPPWAQDTLFISDPNASRMLPRSRATQGTHRRYRRYNDVLVGLMEDTPRKASGSGLPWGGGGAGRSRRSQHEVGATEPWRVWGECWEQQGSKWSGASVGEQAGKVRRSSTGAAELDILRGGRQE